MPWGGHWMGSWTMGPLWILVLVLVAVLVWRIAARRGGAPPQNDSREAETPEEILRRRFARGEIDEREYERRREALRR